MRKIVAIVWGGYSSEKEVSEKSAKGIYSFIDKEKYHAYKVMIDKNSWEVEYQNQNYPINKNDFSFTINERRIKFDFAYITIHGTPGEDGLLQGYFDMLNIPYSNCGVLASSMTFNKFAFNNFISNFGYKIADSILLRQHDKVKPEEVVARLGLPVFVKPNVGGSSFATTKVKDISKIQQAVDVAFKEAPEVMIESFISGTEVTCGCYKRNGEIIVLPVTEVVSKNEFFDYDAKYKGEVEEITPARISKESTMQIQQLTKDIYRLIDAKGVIRADYIISDNQPKLLEVNTTPGITETSFIPQQVAAAGMSMTNVITEIIEESINIK